MKVYQQTWTYPNVTLEPLLRIRAQNPKMSGEECARLVQSLSSVRETTGIAGAGRKPCQYAAASPAVGEAGWFGTDCDREV